MLIIPKLLLPLFLLFPILSFSMSVGEAYKLIPHKQTTYMSSKSPLDSATKHELEKLFKIVDEGVVARFSAFQKLYYAHPAPGAISSYKTVISKLLRLSVSIKVRPVKEKIISSMKHQVQYLESWSREITKKAIPFNPGDSNVQNATRTLKTSYSDLMSLFPSESEHNKQAFFDHLCALDFL